MAAPEITLRLYRPSDFEMLYRIDQACFPRGIAYGRDELKSYLRCDGSHCLLAVVGNEVAGFILTGRSGKLGHIVTLDVLEAHRRQRVGSSLLRAAEQEAASHGVKRMYLETATDNKPEIALWEHHGYRKSGTVKNYYGRGLDAFEMYKPLGAMSHTDPN
ncbi:MAG: GNAT family N-acetyltransferase [Acidobacteriia bacterium]|nr:GNAT family N-acetyltransferase [Terriglobia bacterium]